MFDYTCKFSTFEIVTLKILGFEGTMYDLGFEGTMYDD